MSPSETELLIAANAALADPAFRERVKEMHSQGVSLVQMVEALGLGRDLTDRIRTILETLPAEVVAGIRVATLDMLDSANHELPVVCSVPSTALDQPVDVVVSPAAGTPTIFVRPVGGH
jgi:hypothetical protein